jgi:hypothetical protein
MRSALLASAAPFTVKMLPGKVVKPAVTRRSGLNSWTQARRRKDENGREPTSPLASNWAPKDSGSDVTLCD